jgi:hypothetical protein
MKKILYLILLLVTGLLIFWLGKRFGSTNVSQQVISNSIIVKEIAELSTLDVQGVANIKRSNIEGNGGWIDSWKKAFIENTVWVSIPYEAKFGVNIDEKNFKVKQTNKKIIIQLPAPQLLSYELKVDRMETSNKKGWLTFQDDETYTDVQKSLYRTSRAQLENNAIYIAQSKEKIKKVMEQYYAPFLQDHTLEIQYEGETKAPALN